MLIREMATMMTFLLFSLQSSLIFNTFFIAGSDIFDAFYYFSDDENYLETTKPATLPDISKTSNFDLSSPSSDICYEKRILEIKKLGFSSLYNSTGYFEINEYSEPSQVLAVDDDYFFLDLDDSEIELLGKHEISDDQNYEGLYESFVNNVFTMLSALSPKSARQSESFEQIQEQEIKIIERKGVVTSDKIKNYDQVLRKESSDEFLHIVKRSYESFLDLEKAEYLAI
jgi:hypothetical protein